MAVFGGNGVHWQIKQTATVEEAREIARAFSDPDLRLPGTLPVAMYRSVKAGGEILLGLNIGTAKNPGVLPGYRLCAAPTVPEGWLNVRPEGAN